MDERRAPLVAIAALAPARPGLATIAAALGRSLGRSLGWARWGIGLALGYAAIVGLVALFYRSFLFPAPKSGLEPEVRGASLWRLAEPASEEVVALFAAPEAGKDVVAFFHGNGDELVDTEPLARELIARGFGVLFIEYPGYGLCASGETTEENIYGAADRALAELAQKGFGPDRVLLLGQSLGSGVATEMAVRGRGSTLVLVSPFTSIADMIARFVPFVPAGLVVRDRFDNLAKAPSVSIPTLVVHGAKDTLVPVEMGHAVGAAIPGARTVVLEGHGHNDMWARRAAEGPSLIDLVVTASAEARAAAGGATHGRRHAGAENGAG